ncbi:hypothetical protein [Marinococcus halotolerans]|uniref:hypothetical protein n=1 Tax=Marinococcus halotolerans TaxID=301092 RepID=UPI0003B5406B|nr:hypothetical protein [Marinococcus halotolerans]
MAGRKEQKQKKDIAKKMMEKQNVNYEDWLHEQHTKYIDDHLLDFVGLDDEDTTSKSQANEATQTNTEEPSERY